MKNEKFVEHVFKSIKDGIPSENRLEIKMELERILKDKSDMREEEFRNYFISTAKPIIETYSRLNIKEELSTMRIILMIFFILTLISLVAGISAMM